MKLYECVKCGRMVRVRSKGLCAFCRPRISKSPSRKVRKKKESMCSFFESVINSFQRISVESGVMIYDFSKKNMCHIFPKRTYKSVSEDINNIIPLTFSEHHEFDYLIDKGDIDKLRDKFPNVCNIIRSRKNYFIDKVTERGRIYNLIMSI